MTEKMEKRKGRWRCVVGQNKQKYSTGPQARLIARLLAPLTRSLALSCSLCSCAPLRSIVCLLPHFAQSQARGTENDSMAFYLYFFLFWTIVRRRKYANCLVVADQKKREKLISGMKAVRLVALLAREEYEEEGGKKKRRKENKKRK